MKDLVRNIKANYKLVLAVLAFGIFMGWIIFHSGNAGKISSSQIEEGHEGHDHSSEDHALWTCSMHPRIKQDKPGQCPICAMDLIPLATNQSAGQDMDPDEIVLSEAAAQLANIQSIKVRKGSPQKLVYLQGKVHADERNIAEITARFGGRIEKLHLNFTGQKVGVGEPLATLYSPDLVTAQKELLEALSFKESRPAFYNAARSKLKLWDLTEEQIRKIEVSGEPLLYFDILSPISGTVMMRHVALGDYLNEGDALFQVTDLSRVWVLFDAYESDLPWIEQGDYVNLSIPSIPGESFEARVNFIDPFIDPSTRVAKVRVELPNSSGALKPQMFASGVLYSRLAESGDRLIIPKSSVLWTGKRSLVYVRVPGRESPTFIYREITLGPEAGQFYVVTEGLKEGETIAVNGVFKIDAAAQLEGKPSMMNPQGGKVSTGHDHGLQEMDIEGQGGDEIADHPSGKHAIFKVAGNCGMCKTRIEEAAKSVESVSMADWNEETKNLEVTFDSGITDINSIQRAIAKAGHDTGKFRATDEVYNKLPGCCKYERLELQK